MQKTYTVGLFRELPGVESTIRLEIVATDGDAAAKLAADTMPGWQVIMVDSAT
jgi:hypothetical protein